MNLESLLMIAILSVFGKGGRKSACPYCRRGIVLLLLAGSLLVPATALAAGEYELNDDRESAYGPIAEAVTYTAGLETDDDQDWFYFYVTKPSQLDITVRALNDPGCGSYIFQFDLYQDRGRRIDAVNPELIGYDEHIRRTVDRGRYFVQSDAGCTGNRFRFTVASNGNITASEACGQAVVRKVRIGSEVKRIKAKIKRARSGPKRRKLKKILRALRVDRKEARQDVRAAC